MRFLRQVELKRLLLGAAVLCFTVIVLSVFIGSKTAYAALAYPPYSTAGIDAKLYGGVQQAINWDQQCYNGLVQERKISGISQRTMINDAPSYKGEQWLSLADTATQNNSSRTAPIVVNYGTTSVPLQLNMIKFLCAGLVSPDGAGAYFPYTDSRVVRFLNNANDRAPNPMGGQTNWPALTDSRFRIDNIRVVQGNGHVTGTAIGNYIGTARQSNTRYWFARPVGFNFVSNSPGGITSTTQIQIEFTLRGYNTYYYNVYQCYQNDLYTYPPSPFNINKCGQNNVTLSIDINVRNHYNLTPTVSLNGQSSIAAGSSAKVINTVALASGSTSTNSTDWRLTELDYAPGTNLTPAQMAAQDSANDACAAFTATGRTGCSISQENKNAIFSNPSTTFNPVYNYTASSSFPVGTQVCFVASVSAPTQSPTPVWRHSQMACMVVSKHPQVQVWGGDVLVRGVIEAGTTTQTAGASTNVFGSWVEYGAFSVGTNKRFASGSGLNGQTNGNQAAWSKLTFANEDTNGNPAYGNFASLANFPPAANAASYFGGITNQQPITGSSINLNTPGLSFPSGSAPIVRTAGNLTITGGTINPGQSIIILSSGTVTIDGPINYTNATLTGLAQIPQVVIVANNINIKDSVNQVDAWLVANNTINTCYNFTGSLNSHKCNVPLLVNGPVVTSHLLLNRTAGADGTSQGSAAETFDLRPDAYLWASLEATEQNKAQTVYSTELPPRF